MRESAELLALRQALERSKCEPLTLQAALRMAIHKCAHEKNVNFDFGRDASDKEKRFDLVVDADVSAQIDALQDDHPGITLSTLVLGCARFVQKALDAS